MLVFRTILLSLVLLFFVLKEFIVFQLPYFSFIVSILPLVLLISWFVTSIFSKEKYRIVDVKMNRFLKIVFRYFRPLASFVIVLGAVLKVYDLHYKIGELLLILGIAIMTFYYWTLTITTRKQKEQHPEIIDDID